MTVADEKREYMLKSLSLLVAILLFVSFLHIVSSAYPIYVEGGFYFEYKTTSDINITSLCEKIKENPDFVVECPSSAYLYEIAIKDTMHDIEITVKKEGESLRIDGRLSYTVYGPFNVGKRNFHSEMKDDVEHILEAAGITYQEERFYMGDNDFAQVDEFFLELLLTSILFFFYAFILLSLYSKYVYVIYNRIFLISSILLIFPIPLISAIVFLAAKYYGGDEKSEVKITTSVLFLVSPAIFLYILSSFLMYSLRVEYSLCLIGAASLMFFMGARTVKRNIHNPEEPENSIT